MARGCQFRLFLFENIAGGGRIADVRLQMGDVRSGRGGGMDGVYGI
jgi:hypothetical protein